MTDDGRLDELIEQLADDLVGYATTRKFPRAVSLEDAAAIAERLQGQVDLGVEARAQAIEKAGEVVACKRGCAGCCEEPIMIFRPEAARVAAWLNLPEQAEIKAAFLEAYPAWKAKIGDTVAALSKVFADQPKRYVDRHVDAWRKGVVCAFNRDGDCTIYPVRPITCRTGHALTTSKYCNGAATESATRATFVPLDQFVARTRKLLAAVHNATLGPRARPESICHLVFEMLA